MFLQQTGRTEGEDIIKSVWPIIHGIICCAAAAKVHSSAETRRGEVELRMAHVFYGFT